jgi:hypothetical protein
MLFLRTLTAVTLIAGLAATLTPRPADATTTTLSIFPYGLVDWQRQIVSATGSGVPGYEGEAVARLGAERAAKLDTLRNLLVTVEAMRTSTGKTVAEIAGRAAVGEAALRFRVTNTRYYSDGSVDIEASLPLSAINAIVAPAVVP